MNRTDGSVALETALLTPLLALLLAGVVGLVAVLADQLAVERAARSIARAVAVDGSAEPGATGLPPGTRVTIGRHAGRVTVDVVARGRVALVPYEVRAGSTAVVEPARR